MDKVRKKAIDKGAITEKQAETMKDKDFIDLLFQPSFSTADQITDVSGRGVGLDVVKTKIEALGGNISAKTIAGEGSTFTIHFAISQYRRTTKQFIIGYIPSQRFNYRLLLANQVINNQTDLLVAFLHNYIVRMQRITRVPKSQSYYVGVINLRGEVVPNNSETRA